MYDHMASTLYSNCPETDRDNSQLTAYDDDSRVSLNAAPLICQHFDPDLLPLPEPFLSPRPPRRPVNSGIMKNAACTGE
ncbi:hypothetical protein GWI33_011131 [Rhynchophorus ferrugineus]|uniref:Uncharacterized protein n=1 Tax=Rhynchophorus ferrugineus TaxID=354439 RepID=A0A834MJC0_RHYFE|nr:hypothetical protein GWI33_011131 [Rhynchophorus ferrugineus]